MNALTTTLRLFAVAALVVCSAGEALAWAPIQAAGRGRPSINLADGVALSTASAAPVDGMQPHALASGDVNDDGVPDVIVGFTGPSGGAMRVYLGNVHSIYPNTPQARAPGAVTAPLIATSATVTVPARPELIGLLDADHDGHLDIVTTAMGSSALSWLRGNGRGDFSTPTTTHLPGRVTAFAVGAVEHFEGARGIVVGITAATGPTALIFYGDAGALMAEPLVLDVPATVGALAVGSLGDGLGVGIAVGAGSNLLVVSGRDVRDALSQSPAPASLSPAWSTTFSSPVKALAAGDFTGNGSAGLAALLGDGALEFVAGTPGRETRHTLSSGWADATQLVAARVSTGPAQDLVIPTPARNQLHVYGAAGPVTLDAVGEPLAILPMRLNSDAQTDFVVTVRGQPEPIVLLSEPAATFTVTSTAASGAGSLRQAILDANASPGADAITFNIPGPGVHSINLGQSSLTDSVTIDATTQPGFAGLPLIELSAHAGWLNIFGGSSTVRGIAFNNFTWESDGSAPVIDLSGAGGHIIEGNFIGTDATGRAVRQNADDGIRIRSSDNTVGGTTLAARNLLSGNPTGINIDGARNLVRGNLIGTDVDGHTTIQNGGAGIRLQGSENSIGGSVAGAANVISGNRLGVTIRGRTNTIAGNFIGTGASGNTALGNDIGIFLSVFDNAEMVDNLIGGTAPGAGNIVSGNNYGVWVRATRLTRTRILGNLIGTNVGGTAPVPNLHGVVLEASENQVGGATEGSRNVISGNRIGILVQRSGNVVQGNFIGTDVTGAAPLGNRHGVVLTGTGHLVGGALDGEGNVISGNAVVGVAITGADNIVRGNAIGTDVGGTVDLANGSGGVTISGDGNAIGGPAAADGNTIAFNRGRGVHVQSGRRNAILSNAIRANTRLGIDLRPDGPSANDLGDADAGANDLQNFPIVTAVRTDGALTTITGTLNSQPSRSYVLQFFSNRGCDTPGYGGAFRGGATVTTGPAGNGSFAAVVPAIPPGRFLTATATDPEGNTSEFSPCQRVFDAVADASVGMSDTPDPAVLGNTVTYVLTVRNAGPVPAHDVRITDTLPATAAFQSVSTTRGACTGTAPVVCTLGRLDPGATMQITLVVKPTVKGTVTNRATVTIFEEDPDPANNTAVATTSVRAADLLLAGLSDPPATQPVGGRFTVSEITKNFGNALSGESVSRYYLSVDTVRGTGDIRLGGIRRIGSLAPGAESSGTARVIVPAETPPGQYHVIACADDTTKVVESDESNNCLASVFRTSLLGADLSVTAVSDPPATMLIGGAFTLLDTTRNGGQGAAGESVTRYHLSLDTTRGTGDIRLRGIRRIDALAPSGESAGRTRVTIPEHTPAGRYYVLACADDLADVIEGDEANNCLGSVRQVLIGP